MRSKEDAIREGARRRSSATGKIRIHAPAKVNLILRVLDRRSDGYHDVWSLLHTVDIADELTVRLRADQTGVALSIDGADLPTDSRNLVTRAATLVLERVGSRVGLEVYLRKVLPSGAGLGGGSSDAAATIIALNELLQLGWTSEEMSRLGATLGSDVPFFFFAPGALARGRGDQVTPVRLVGTRWMVLVQPGVRVDTAWAYRQLASARGAVRTLSPALRALEGEPELKWEDILPLLENDFEEALHPVHPSFRAIKQELVARGAEGALLSGSGSTIFGVFRTEGEAAGARASLSAEGYWTASAKTCTAPLACCFVDNP